MLTTFSGRKPSQDEGELTSFVEFLRARGVKRYLEIGARDGDTFHFVMSALGAWSFGLAVDLPGGLWGKRTTSAHLLTAVQDLALKRYDVRMRLGDSTAADIIGEIHKAGPFDAILIDGDHTYEGVKADWENYRDLASLIAFHDIVGHGQAEKVTNRAVEVPRLWAEIKAEGYRTVEFISPGSAMGIGIVEMLP